ncbi:hypothetical protein MNBD_GAMMA20-2487 [hydrothermal vent metagenome]|uniref:Uncharacterized protein n=1 Tax=hydrothermal vent metagenome TaxID=652676 RepID=A0A3B1B202_9ZZZZ
MLLRSLLVFVLSVFLVACGGGVKEDIDTQKLAETNLHLAIGYFKQGRIEASRGKLQKALQAAPDYAPAHGALALVYQRLGELDKADEHFKRALSLDPMDGRTHNNYAVMLCQTGKLDEAEKHFLIALKSRNYQTPASVFENLGVCVLQKPDIKQAEKYLRRALQIDPALPVALLRMAQISLDNQRFLSGRAYLQRYQAVAPDTAGSLWLGIQIETQLGDEAAVHDYANQLSRHFPDSDELGLLLDMEARQR